MATVVPIETPSTKTVTVDKGSAVPMMVGVVSAVVELFAGVVTTGAPGAWVSMVKVLVLDVSWPPAPSGVWAFTV